MVIISDEKMNPLDSTDSNLREYTTLIRSLWLFCRILNHFLESEATAAS